MSGIGKTSSGFRKTEYKETRSLSRVVKTLRFAHKSAAGETYISLAALNTPSEMSSQGFVNPNPADLAGALLLTQRNNLRLKSTARGELEEHLDFVVTGNSRINFVAPLVTLEDEIFIGVIDNPIKTANVVTDAASFAATGELALGVTDFPIGFPVPVTSISGSQMPSIAVFRNGQIQFQNKNNSPSGTGNYYLVPTAGGVSTVIRFNTPGATLLGGAAETVAVFPIGSLPFNPTDGMLATLETLAGQVDAIVPVLAAAAGVPESTFQAAPNSADLRQFGSDVLDARQRITALEAVVDEHVFIKNVLSSGTTDDTPVAAGYQQRRLNTLENPLTHGWVSLTTNQFTLQPGTYLLEGSFPASGENDLESLHKAKVRNVTDSSDAVIGTAELSSLLVVGATAGGTPTTTRSFVSGYITIATAKTFEIQHRIANVGSGASFGYGSGFGESEVHAVLKIRKIR